MRIQRRLGAAIVIAIAASPAACNLILGLDQFQDYCFPYGNGSPPDCAPFPGAGGAGSTSTSMSTASTASGEGGDAQGGGGHGTTTAGGAGAGGGPEPCSGNGSRSCYDFATGTPTKGQCKAGTQHCVEGVWGPCEGEVGPSAEDCSVAGDEDCDGIACSDLVWSTSFGQGGLSDKSDLIAVAQDGSVYLWTDFNTAFPFGGTALQPGAQQTGVLMKLHPDKSPDWAKVLSSTGASVEARRAVAVDASGNVVIAGVFGGTVDFGAGGVAAYATSPNRDLFAAEYDSTGALLWAYHVASGNPAALAIGSNGDVVVAGDVDGTIDLGQGNVTTNGSDALVLKLSGGPNGGALLWGQVYGERLPITMSGDQRVTNVVVAADDTIVIGGSLEADLVLGSINLVSAGGADIFIAALDSSGDATDASSFGDAADQFLGSMTIDAQNKVWAAGFYQGSLDFGGAQLMTSGPGDTNVFLAAFQLSPGNLTPAFSRSFGDDQLQIALGVAVDKDRNVVMTGVFQGSLDFGGGTLTNTSGATGFLAKFDPGGSHLWSKTYGGNGHVGVPAVAIPAGGSDIFLGMLGDNIDFGTGPGGVGQIYVAKFQP